MDVVAETTIELEKPKSRGVQLRFANKDDFQKFFPLGQELADESCFARYGADRETCLRFFNKLTRNEWRAS